VPRILNFGSINIDHVYKVEKVPSPGETIKSSDYFQSIGGKGFNQSIALARAGAQVTHAGRYGRNEKWLSDRLISENVDVFPLHPVDQPTGHAIIQVEPSGRNTIIVHPGANHALELSSLPGLFEGFSSSDWFLAQNETSYVAESLSTAHALNMTICFNPGPMDDSVINYPLEVVDWLILNESEGTKLTNETTPELVLKELRKRCPRAQIILTMGSAGACCLTLDEKRIYVSAKKVQVVDTTGAGDTFIGFLLASCLKGAPLISALELACEAAALSVTRLGAADSIPHLREVQVQEA